MSVYNGNSFRPSILKKSSLQDIVQSTPASASKVRFVIPYFQNFRKLLLNYLEHGLGTDFPKLIKSMKDPQVSDDELSFLLQEATDCIPLMNNDFTEFVNGFLDGLLSIEWADRDKKMENEYQSFLVNLLVAHNCLAKVVIDRLLYQLGSYKRGEDIKSINVHSVLDTLLKLIPMCNDILLDSLSDYTCSLSQCSVLRLLHIFSYQPWLKSNILHLIFSRLVDYDVEYPREVVRELYRYENLQGLLEYGYIKETDIKDDPGSWEIPMRDELNECLNIMLDHLFDKCHNKKTRHLDWDNIKEVYEDLLKVFDDVILPTYNCNYIQFCLFFICGLEPRLAEAFIEHLWKKFINPSVAAVIRQTSVLYIASFVARASYVTTKTFKSIIEQLASWIHAYINTQDGLECVNSDVRVHSVFYSTCQALFYVTTFRHKEMVRSKKNMTFLQNLNFTKIVTSRLNPLRVCPPAVVQIFAAFTRNYQLAYCYSISEHNARNVRPTVYQSEKGAAIQTSGLLDGYYPFDPLVLYRCGEKIYPLYREYEESNKSDKEVHRGEDDVLDVRKKFSYETSPGYGRTYCYSDNFC